MSDMTIDSLAPEGMQYAVVEHLSGAQYWILARGKTPKETLLKHYKKAKVSTLAPKEHVALIPAPYRTNKGILIYES
jgi:hypothetical protein